MFDMFKMLTMADILYAAVLAFVLLQIISSISSIRKNVARNKRANSNLAEHEKYEILKKCVALFPFETINFRGKVFTKGARVRITTLQKRIIEGEIIGRNDMNIICVMTGNHIIAHEIEKIEDITEIVSQNGDTDSRE